MESLLRKTATLTTTAILSFSFLLLAACGTQKKTAEMSTETNTVQNENASKNSVAPNSEVKNISSKPEMLKVKNVR